jgi:hypothetical protein
MFADAAIESPLAWIAAAVAVLPGGGSEVRKFWKERSAL